MHLEGVRLKAYWDATGKELQSPMKVYPFPHKDLGYLTIGVGHLLTQQELIIKSVMIGNQPIPWEKGLTQEQVEVLLEQDLIPREIELDRVVPPMPQNKYDALVIFVFNIGVPRFLESTVLRDLKQGLFDAIPSELRKWNKSGGKKNPSLVTRREAEIAIWNADA